MRSGHLHADTRLTFRHNRIIESGDVYAFFLEGSCEVLRETRVVQHNRTDSRLRRFDVEACGFHLLHEIRGVLMQTILQFVGTREDLEGLDTCRSNHRRNGVREEIRTTALTQQVDDLFLTGSETADRTAKGFAQRAGDNLYLTTHVIEFGHTVSGLADNSGGVRLIDHDEGVIFLRKLVDLIQRTHITVHGEDTIGSDDTEALCLRFLELLLKIRHVTVGITVTHCLAKTHTIDDRRMVERIRDDRILFRQQRFEKSSVGIKTSGIKDRVFRSEEIGDDALEFLVGVLRTADKTHRRHTITARIHTGFSGLDKLFVISESEVVVRAEVDHFLSAFYGYAGGLRSNDHALVLIKSCFANLIQRFLQVLLKISVHSYFVMT